MERVDMDQNHPGDAADRQRSSGGAENHLEPAGDDPRLAEDEEEGDDAYQRGKCDGENRKP